MPAQPENPKGFWEHLEIYHLQERILTACGRAWDSPLPLPEEWCDARAVSPLARELAVLVGERFAPHPLWLWKDPRTCLLLPLWRRLLSRMSVGLRVLFVVRNPLDVARSLHKRNGYHLDKGFGIWLHYNLAAMYHLDGLDVVWLSFDRFLDDWEGELRRCASALGISWPGDESSLRQEMDRFVRPDLRHSRSSMADLREAEPPEPVVRLYGLLRQCLADGEISVSVRREVERLYGEFLSWSRFFVPGKGDDAPRPHVPAHQQEAQVRDGRGGEGAPSGPARAAIPFWARCLAAFRPGGRRSGPDRH